VPSRRFHSDLFEFDPLPRQLRRHGTPIKLDPQATALLAFLIEEPGKLCSYEELPGSTLGRDDRRV
jgi:DNA-binding response OmpR family regulator